MHISCSLLTYPLNCRMALLQEYLYARTFLPQSKSCYELGIVWFLPPLLTSGQTQDIYSSTDQKLTLVWVCKPPPTLTEFERVEHTHPILLVALHNIPILFVMGNCYLYLRALLKFSYFHYRFLPMLGVWLIPEVCIDMPYSSNINPYRLNYYD